MTEKEIEGLLELETRYLPVPNPLSVSEDRPITTFKKRPVTISKYMWQSFDFLTDSKWELYNRHDLIKWALQNAEEVRTDFNISFQCVLAHAHTHARREILGY